MLDEKHCVVVAYDSDNDDYIEDVACPIFTTASFGDTTSKEVEPVWQDVLQAVRDFRQKIGFKVTDTDPLAQFHRKDLVDEIQTAIVASMIQHHLDTSQPDLVVWLDLLDTASENSGYVQHVYDANGDFV